MDRVRAPVRRYLPVAATFVAGLFGQAVLPMIPWWLWTVAWLALGGAACFAYSDTLEAYRLRTSTALAMLSIALVGSFGAGQWMTQPASREVASTLQSPPGRRLTQTQKVSINRELVNLAEQAVIIQVGVGKDDEAFAYAEDFRDAIELGYFNAQWRAGVDAPDPDAHYAPGVTVVANPNNVEARRLVAWLAKLNVPDVYHETRTDEARALPLGQIRIRIGGPAR